MKIHNVGIINKTFKLSEQVNIEKSNDINNSNILFAAHPNNTQKNTLDLLRSNICIIGTGPSGMLSAIKIADKYKNSSSKPNIMLIDYQRKNDSGRKNNILFPENILVNNNFINIKNRSYNMAGSNNSASIKAIEKSLRKTINNNFPDIINFFNVNSKLDANDIKKIIADDIILAMGGSNHSIAKNLGFKYIDKIDINNQKINDYIHIKALQFNFTIKLKSQLADEIIDKIIDLPENDGSYYYFAYARKHESTKNGSFTTIYINTSSANLKTDKVEVSAIKDNTINQESVDQFKNKFFNFLHIDDLLKNNEISIDTTTFTLGNQETFENNNFLEFDKNKRIHIIGDQAITPYYPHAEGIKNADATIELVLQNLKYV